MDVRTLTLSSRALADNEVVLSQELWASHLPSTITAVFYLRGGACAASVLCEARARLVHRLLASEYGGDTASGVPLLVLDPSDWHAPFGVDGAWADAAEDESIASVVSSSSTESVAEAVREARQQLARDVG